jgi:hypothetical protein
LFYANGRPDISKQKNFPWINIGIVYTKDGNYAINNRSRTRTEGLPGIKLSPRMKNEIKKINLITVTTSRKIEQNIYIEKLLNIANKINWKLYLEEDEDGNENIVINNIL